MYLAFLIRHAEPVAGWHGSDHDRPLSERGRRQAQFIAGKLVGSGIQRIVCSPYARTRETAQIIGAGLGVSPQPEPRLAIGCDFAVELHGPVTLYVAHANSIPEALWTLGVQCTACGHAGLWRVTVGVDGRATEAKYTEARG